MPGVTVQGEFATHTTEQDTIGTVGGGKIVIGDKANSTPADKINRDTTKTRVITKDTSSGVKLYASSNSIIEVAKG
jgi:hypothetical protein